MLDLREAIDFALAGEAILFTGAGASQGAFNLRGVPLKRGSQLAQHLAAKVGFAGDTPLTDAAEEFAERFGDDELIAELQQEFTTRSVSDSHLTLARVPWRRIYTTNYDNVMESAYSQVGEKLVPVTPSDDPQRMPSGHSVIVHLNGYVDKMTRSSIGSEVKLTDSSYLTASLVDSVWMVLFRQDLSVARAVFFLGFSVADLDIGRLLFATPELHGKCFFVIGTSPDAGSLRRARTIGQAIQISVDDFAEAVAERRKGFDPTAVVSRLGRSISKLDVPTSIASLSDQAVFHLLMNGDINQQLVWGSLHGGSAYVLERTLASQALEHMRSGERAIMIHSDLGNGKSVAVETIKARALEAGYDVYSVFRRTDDLFAELDSILAKTSPTLIAIEEYADWLDVVEYVALRRKPTHAMLLTARTSTHDVRIDDLFKALHNDQFVELAVDRLDEGELKWFVDFLDRYGLWGEMASWSSSRKHSFLAGSSCKREVHAILLKILESPQIVSKLSAVFDAIANRRDYHEVIISILALAVLNRYVALSTLLDVWGDVPLDGKFRRNAAVSQLISFERGEITARSAVAAEFVLRKVADANIVVTVLARIARKADAASRASTEYRAMIRTLMRFSSLQAILPEKDRRAATIRYYESIKSLGSCERNPLFWLQYAIASLVYGDLGRAERYFETAYSLARARGWDTYQIDNHYARYVLAASIDSDDPTSAMSAFRRARKTINEQVKNERLHYPYRVASQYSDFYDRFASRLTPADRDEIGNAARFVLNRILELPATRQRERDVRRCKDAMEYVLARVESDTKSA